MVLQNLSIQMQSFARSRLSMLILIPGVRLIIGLIHFGHISFEISNVFAIFARNI